jgi:hypothetical protein
MRQVVVGHLHEICNEIGRRFEAVGRKAIPEAGESTRKEHDHQVPEVGRSAHRPFSVDVACMTLGWCFQ